MTPKLPPLILRHEGEGYFVCPSIPMQRICDRLLAIGETIRVERSEEVSQASRSHFFANLDDAWASLKEPWATEWPTPLHMRKHLLCRIGHCDIDKIVLDTEAAALAVAAYARRRDGYAIVSVAGCVVTTHTARSIDNKTVNNKEFAVIKEKVFLFLAEILETDPLSLSKAEAA